MYTRLKWECSLNCFWRSSPIRLRTVGFSSVSLRHILASTWENLFMPYANNKGEDQPVHPHSLIRAFVVRCIHSLISKFTKFKISSQLVSVADQAGLSLAWSETSEDTFSHDMALIVTTLNCHSYLMTCLSKYTILSLATKGRPVLKD